MTVRQSVLSAWIALIALAALAGPASGQKANRLTECHTCTVELTKVARIGGLENEWVTGFPVSAARDRHGRYLFIFPKVPSGRSLPVAFDSTGRFVRRLSSVGAGPGELREPSWLDVGFDDTLRAFQDDRIVVFANLEAVRTIVIRDPPALAEQVTMLSKDHFLVRQFWNDWNEDLAIPIFLYGTNGRRVDTLRGNFRKEETWAYGRASAESFFAVEGTPERTDGFRIKLRDIAGRDSLMFSDHFGWSKGSQDGIQAREDPMGAGSRARGIRADPKGRLLLLGESTAPPIKSAPKVGPNDRRTLVKVIDPRGKRQVESRWIRERPVGFLDDTHIATYQEDNDGVPWVTVWAIIISGM